MQALRLIIVLGLALSIPLALAQDQEGDHASHHPAPTTDSGASQASSDGQAASKSSPAQDNMNKVERLMQQVQETDDPAQKRQLLDEHLQALRDQLRLIRGQDAPMKMSMKEDGKREDGMKKKGGMMGEMMTMHKKVEEKLDMLERTMQQIVERAVAQESGKQH
jgi:hypothetical protein